MTFATSTATGPSWFVKAVSWLDERGPLAWTAAMVLAFVVVWPVGLAILGYVIWSKRMFNGKCRTRNQTRHARLGTSGNTAFDAYKAETLRRLEDEQGAFEQFMERLRAAKDKSEFDAFMDDRAKTTTQSEAFPATDPA
jgi:hypothetical protein